MALVLLTVIVVLYALISLQRINALNKSIVKNDIIVQEAADKMFDALLAQDTFEKRFLILKSDDIRALFLKRGEEFRSWLSSLKSLPDNDLPLDQIAELHAHYSNLFYSEIQLVQSQKMEEAYAVSNGELKTTLERLIDTVRTMSLKAKEAQDGKMQQISTIGGTAFATTAVLCAMSILLGAIAGLVVTHHIASSIHKLKVGTQHIAEGNFDFDPENRYPG